MQKWEINASLGLAILRTKVMGDLFIVHSSLGHRCSVLAKERTASIPWWEGNHTGGKQAQGNLTTVHMTAEDFGCFLGTGMLTPLIG